jgi:hypothetical protein
MVVENELFWLSCNWVAMNCTIYMMNYNSTIHATCLLALTMYKYSELQMSSTTQKLSCKASCKTPIFLVVNGVIDKMHLLVCDQHERAFELGQNAIIQKLDDNYCHVCS